ncbi:MAG: ABC transporter permease [Bacillota bacterium]|nr:ABC transporter permease [Thermoanaerobacteraceae bacterium]
MKRCLLERLFYLVPVMLGVSVVTFGLINLAPGDPAEVILRTGGVEPTREAVETLRAELGLNDPLYVRYGRWLRDVVRLDLGDSFRTGYPVTQEILSRLPATLELTCAALVFMVLLALPFLCWSTCWWTVNESVQDEGVLGRRISAGGLSLHRDCRAGGNKKTAGGDRQAPSACAQPPRLLPYSALSF